MQISLEYFISAILLFGIHNQIFAQLANRWLYFGDAGYEKVLGKAKLTRSLCVIPSGASIKMYAPYPKSQEPYETRFASAKNRSSFFGEVKNNSFC